MTEGTQIGYLTTKWYWTTKNGRIWKCECECGNLCYVKEDALKQLIVHDCGCGTYEQDRKMKKCN